VVVSVCAGAVKLRNVRRTRMYFGFIGIDLRVGIGALEDYGFV